MPTLPFVKPFLHALDQMQQRETLRPEQLTERARALLVERFGASSQGAEAAFVHGMLGLLAEHTLYFNGFAVMYPMAQGMAVAVRATDAGRSRIAREGYGDAWTFDRRRPADAAQPAGWTAEGAVLEALVRALAPPGAQVEMTVVHTLALVGPQTHLAALAGAAIRALQALYALPDDAEVLLQRALQHLAAQAGRPFSMAYQLATDVGRPGAFVVVDTDRFEQLPLEAPPFDRLGWGLIDVGPAVAQEDKVYAHRQQQLDKALTRIQKKGFPRVMSFRDIDHQDLKRALATLPRSARPLVSFVVKENHRVQKLVRAIRGKDWQMLGALLLMSHAARRDDAALTHPQADFVVAQVEAMSLDGMYGAALVGSGRSVLVVGQPFAVPQCLDHLKAALVGQFNYEAETMLL